MTFKKVKRLLSQFLIIAVLMPNLNVMASPNELNSKVEVEITSEEVIQNNQNSESNNADVNETNEADSVNKEESINEDTTIEEVKDENENSSEVKNDNNEASVILESDTTNNDETNVGSLQAPKESLKGKVYEKKKAINSTYRSSFSMYSSLVEEREEFRLKREALENLEILEPMTEKDYELTIANSDGNYEFVEAYDNLEDAVSSAKNLEASVAENQEPAVINYYGQVVYSTNQMARIIKYSNNSTISGNIDVYSDSALKNKFTYVNPSYVDDAPVLDVVGTSAKVMINGYEGWINNNTASGTYDMIIVPITTVTNPSYYTVKNGELVHFISSDLTGNIGSNKILGKAPFYLKEGVRYLSYDGKYFYQYNHNDRNDIASKLKILIEDYKAGVRANSVNSSNPYYIYYLNLPFRSQTVYSANDLNKYINENTKSNSKLRGLGQAFKDAEATYGVNALLALGVSINESAYGTSNIAMTKNNLFGLKAYDSAPGESADIFATPKDSVNDFAKNWISRGYADPADWRYYGGFLGNKNRGANVKYASDPFWGEKAASFAYEIDKYLSGGNTNLKDTNSKQIGIATSNSTVIKSNGTLLYNVNDLGNPAAYINTPFVVSNLQQVAINGKKYYEIYPERNTPVSTGKFSGNYNWNDRGYIEASNISFTNEYIPPVEVEYGLSRYDTAVEVSKSQFTSAETIVISNGYAIPDGLTATPIASYYKAPLLLVDTTSIPVATQNEIKRLNAKNVIIVGGTGVVTQQVETQLRNLGISKITRLGGIDRYATALQVAKYIDSNLYDVENVVIANGYGEPDALSIAPVSGRDRMPIILVDNNYIPTDVNKWLKSEDLNTAYIIGGSGIISNNVMNQINSMTKQNISANRLGGIDRYETNARVIERFYGELVNKVYITEGTALADALTAGPVAALNESPVVIADYQISGLQRTILDKKRTNSIVQVGGVVSKSIVEDLRKLLKSVQ
ncbi:cell wall-binding repeat-containing protein [Clostridium sp.]|uniref:cell wall-binding repeat-containing protein n=1 Tax=Clostridium sp. TaxID=1506 RepID=UPI002910F042|nr:cell wall-binding repeat-containing protein [Clostridium sp.]MDU5105827.1 cell wall-binding repeat-containing protein [Clostridium sp.]